MRRKPLERTTKQRVKDLLDPRKPDLYYNMPVPSGYGESQLDFVGCYRGLFFTIETKREGKFPTGPQERIIDAVRDAGGKVFVIQGGPNEIDGLHELEHWLLSLEG
jgi:hypothetical protein